MPTPCWALLLLTLVPVPQVVLPLEWCPRFQLWSGEVPRLHALWRHPPLLSRQWVWLL